MAREKLLQGLKYQYGANATLYRAEATQQRQYLSLLAKQLMMQHLISTIYGMIYSVERLKNKLLSEHITNG